MSVKTRKKRVQHSKETWQKSQKKEMGKDQNQRNKDRLAYYEGNTQSWIYKRWQAKKLQEKHVMVSQKGRNWTMTRREKQSRTRQDKLQY